MPDGFKNPGEYKMDYEDVEIKCKDRVKLHAWFVKTKDYKNS